MAPPPIDSRLMDNHRTFFPCACRPATPAQPAIPLLALSSSGDGTYSVYVNITVPNNNGASANNLGARECAAARPVGS